jgi:putative transposase
MLQGNGITISMDGRGRALDNIFVERLWRTVKYEEVYLKQHSNMPDLLMGLTQYFQFYNQKRWHQALDYKTPDEVYKTARGGGAKIVDKFNGTAETSALVPQNWDSAIQLECDQGSSLN